MKFKFILYVYFLIIPYTTCPVCDLELLILELKQDLEYNGLLNCLREIPEPLGYNETSTQRNKRLSAQWDTSCSFESSSNWFEDLSHNYGVSTLVNALGEPVPHNIPSQADMCEIIRAIISSGFFPQTSDVTNIPIDIFNYIDCPGKICAVNSISFYKKDMWTIFLASSAITINNKPSFRIDNDDEYITKHTQHHRGNIVQKSRKYIKNERIVNLYISNQLVENVLANQNWINFKSTDIHIKHDTPFHLFTFTMISPFTSTYSRFLIQLTLNNKPIPSSRMIHGFQSTPSLTTSLLTHLSPGSYSIQTQYKSNTPIHLDPHAHNNDNIISTALSFPSQNLLLIHSYNTHSFSLDSTNTWTSFPYMNITNIHFKQNTHCIIMYSLSLAGMNHHILTHIDINKNEIRGSRSIAGDSMFWGIHNVFIYEFEHDTSYEVVLKYRTAFNAKVNPSESEFEQQSIAIMELPKGVEVVKIEGKGFEMECGEEWMGFPGVEVDIEVEDDVEVIVMYNVVVPVVNKVMGVGVFVNGRLEKRSIAIYGGVMYFKAMGMMGKRIMKGRNRIELKYKTQACVTYDPDTDWQSVSMSILKLI